MTAFVLMFLADTVLGSPGVASPERLLGELGATLATSPAEVRPALDRWLESGGDLPSARTLLLSGGRRGCTGSCAEALLSAARDALVAGRSTEDAVALVLDAQHESSWLRLAAPLTDAELGHAVRRATAERLRPR